MFNEYIHYSDLSSSQIKAVEKFVNDRSYIYEKIDCPLCGEKEHKILFKNDRYKINQNTVMCNKCGLMYSNPRLNSESSKKFYNSDTYRLIYSNVTDEKNSNFFTDTCKEIKNHKFISPKKPNFKNYYKNLYFDFINYEINDFKSVCDLGCGKGFKLIDFSKLGKETFGVEPSNILNECHKKFNINSICGFIDDVKNKYDLVIISHVLEHLNNIPETISKIKDITNKYLYIEVPGHFTRIQSIQNAHNYYFSFNTLNYFIENNDFKLLKMNYARDSEFIMAIYKKTKIKTNFNYKFKNEKKLVNKLIYKYKLKYIIIKILRIFKLEKLAKKIIFFSRKKLFFQKTL